jgi:hypothetical protein
LAPLAVARKDKIRVGSEPWRVRQRFPTKVPDKAFGSPGFGDRP